MNKYKQNGFTIIEVIVSVTFFSIIASSIYLMSSFLIFSNKIIIEEHISEIFYRSYMERLKKTKFSSNYINDNVYSFDGKKSFNIKIKETPNHNILSINLIPKNQIKKTIVTYRRKF